MYLTGFHHRDIYGSSVATSPEIALPKIAERARYVCALLQQNVAQSLTENQVDYLQGTGAPRSQSHGAGGDRRWRYGDRQRGRYSIATGSRPLRPTMIPFEDPDVCDSDQIFKLSRVPTNLFIVGGGPIGVEFATIFAALGRRVTLSDMGDRLLPMMDGELSRFMAEYFTRTGVQVILGVGTKSVERSHGRLRVTLSDGNTLSPDAVLFAAGRRANTEGLGADEVGVELDRHGRIIVDGDYRTTVDGIYAAGDVVQPSLASIAMEQGRIAMFRAFGLPFKKAVDPLTVSAVYGVLEVAGVGLTEEQCQQQGIDYEVGRCDLAVTARGAIAGHGGLLKLIFRRDDRRLLGVHIIGDIASEVVGMGQMAINSGEAIDVFGALTLNTPTYTYAYKYATFDGVKRLAATQGGLSAFADNGHERRVMHGRVCHPWPRHMRSTGMR